MSTNAASERWTVRSKKLQTVSIADELTVGETAGPNVIFFFFFCGVSVFVVFARGGVESVKASCEGMWNEE
jgi:hypothetical protein